MTNPLDSLIDRITLSANDNRVVVALRELKDFGFITTDRLSELGYGHPPRAAGDIRDLGIPLVTKMVKSEKTGRRMAKYVLGTADDLKDGRTSGRRALPKSLKIALMKRDGPFDALTGHRIEESHLQVDHRIPYRVQPDPNAGHEDPDRFMLLGRESQRAKSWACEHCANIDHRDIAVCSTCYFAYPDNYTHIATVTGRMITVPLTPTLLEKLAEKYDATSGEALTSTVVKIVARHLSVEE